MQKEQGKRLTLSIISSTMAVLCSYAINFFITPYITNRMGAEAYGFISLASNFVSYANIITIALNSYAVRFIAIGYHQGDFNKAKKYFSSIFYADIIIGSVIFILSILIVQKLEVYIDVPKEIIIDVKVLFILVFISFFISTINTVYFASAYIANRLYIVGIFRTFSYMVQAIFLILLYMFLKPAVWYMGACTILSGTIVIISNMQISKRYTPELRISIKDYNFKYVKEVIGAGIWNSVNSLGNALNSGLDLIISNIMLSSLAMGQLAIAKIITSVSGTLVIMIAQTFQPIFLQNYSAGEINKLLGNFKFSMKVSGLVSNITFAGFAVIGLNFYKLWIPEQNIKLLFNITLIVMLGNVVEGAMYPVYYIYTLKIKNRVPCFITIFGGVLNVLGMYFLLKYTNMGIYSIVLTTAIIMSMINFITNPIYMAHCMEQKWWYFYPTIIRHVLSCIVMTGVFRIIAPVLKSDNWLKLIICIVFFGLIGIVIHAAITIGKRDIENLKTYFLRYVKRNV